MHLTRKLSFLALLLLLMVALVVYAQDGGSREDAVPIEVGQAVSDELTSDQLQDYYSYEGSQGDVLMINLSAETFDTYLRLWDSNGSELVTDDDSAGNLDSRIGPYTLPDDGTYTIVVDSFSRDATGPYTLNVATVEVHPIEYTQVFEGSFSTASPASIFNFRGQQGDTITIAASSPTLDTSISLTREGQSYPDASASSGGAGATALIGPYTLPETGNYLVNVSTYAAGTGGDFTLSVNRVELTPISFGETTQVELTESAPIAFFSLEASAGEVVTIEADSGGTLDTVLTVNGPDNYQVATDDDGGQGFDPEINSLVLSQAGTYTIVLRPFGGGEAGTVNLSVSESELASLDEGPQQVRLSSKRYSQVLTFTGTAGEEVRLTVDVISGGSAPNITVSQSGSVVTSTSASNVSEVTFTFRVPGDGVVNIQLDDYSYSSAMLEVRLEHLGTE